MRMLQLTIVAMMLCTLVHAQDQPTPAPGSVPGSAPGTAAGTATVAPKTPSFTEQYGVIIDRNMFIKERRRPRQPGESRPDERAPAPPPPPEKQFVLVGIVFENAEVRAYFEHLGQGTIVKIGPGDAIARGLVTDVQLDAVAFAHDGELRWIDIGHDLTGAAVTPAATASTATPPSAAGATTSDSGAPGTASAPAAGSAPPADDANLSVAERMRRRRQQETQR